MFSQEAIDKFWSRVDKRRGENGCWFYMPDYYSDQERSQRQFTQQGFSYAPGRSMGAHKFAYLSVGGVIPDGDQYVLRHRCAVGGCCNPAHLVPGTYKENSMDWAARAYAGIEPGELATYDTIPGYTPSSDRYYQSRFDKYASGRGFQDVVSRAIAAGLTPDQVRRAIELAIESTDNLRQAA